MAYSPRCEGSNQQRGSVRKYLATVRIGGQSVKTVIVADSAAHAGLLLRYQYGPKNVVAGPAKIEEGQRYRLALPLDCCVGQRAI